MTYIILLFLVWLGELFVWTEFSCFVIDVDFWSVDLDVGQRSTSIMRLVCFVWQQSCLTQPPRLSNIECMKQIFYLLFPSIRVWREEGVRQRQQQLRRPQQQLRRLQQQLRRPQHSSQQLRLRQQQQSRFRIISIFWRFQVCVYFCMILGKMVKTFF